MTNLEDTDYSIELENADLDIVDTMIPDCPLGHVLDQTSDRRVSYITF